MGKQQVCMSKKMYDEMVTEHKATVRSLAEARRLLAPKDNKVVQYIVYVGATMIIALMGACAWFIFGAGWRLFNCQ